MTLIERSRSHFEEGETVTPAYTRVYDTLAIAVGSQTNDFGTPGVAEHAIALETPEQAQRFHRRLVSACLRAHMHEAPLGPRQLQVAIIGAGPRILPRCPSASRSRRPSCSKGWA